MLATLSLDPITKINWNIDLSNVFFLSISLNIKDTNVYTLLQVKFFLARDVVFDEFLFPYALPKSSTTISYTTSAKPPLISLPLSTTLISNSNVPCTFPYSPNASSHSSIVPSLDTSPLLPTPSTSSPQIPSSTHRMTTRSQNGIFKPKVYFTHTIPRNVPTALSDPNWKLAMQEDYHALQKNKTWSLIPLPLGKTAIGCKWVFSVKENLNGTIQRNKARLVAKGFRQREGIDFHETFSPVVKPTTTRVLLSLALTHNWSIRKIDISNVFLNGVLKEDVYMQQPPGFENGDKTLVYKLHKSLYGLKQALQAWFESLSKLLLSFGFVFSRCDKSLFMKTITASSLHVLVYVDDIIIIGYNASEVQ